MPELTDTKASRIFAAETLSDRLPERARLYLAHSIRQGAVLARQVVITFHGKIRLKPKARWHSFHAMERIDVNRSFRVSSHSRMGPIPVRLFDQYKPDQASSRTLLLGRLTIKRQSGYDLNRAAHSRVMVESAWLPTAYLPENGAAWFEKDGSLRLTARVAEDKVELTLQLDANGGLRELSCMRWSNLTEDGSYSWIPFTSITEEEKTFGDYILPSKIRSTWWAGTQKAFDFMIAQVDDAHFSP
jgi:Family of unknown function (DUF6544)